MESSPTDESKYLEEYIKSLNEKERMAYEIAKDHLASSFSLYKSRGYIAWKKKNYPTIA